jgi:hypothetical protein
VEQLKLAAKLVEMSNAKIAAFVFAINLFDLGGSDNLVKKGYKVENLMDFPRALIGSGKWNRTTDLRLMSPAL